MTIWESLLLAGCISFLAGFVGFFSLAVFVTQTPRSEQAGWFLLGLMGGGLVLAVVGGLGM